VEAAGSDLPSGTVTFLFTDVEGSTDLARTLGPRFGAVRANYRHIVREALTRHGGHEIDTAGDGFFVAFQRAGDAVQAAAAAQRALADAAANAETPLRVRMGLHTAEPFLDDDGYVGVGVHRAARICAVAHGGQILMSNATSGIVEDIGLSGVRLHEIGEHWLKDMERPQRLVQLDVEGLAAEFPPPSTGSRSPLIGTLLALDLAGWTRVMSALGDDETVAAAGRYHRIVAVGAEKHGGRLVEAVADTALALFERPVDAVHGAVAIREAIAKEDWIAAEYRPRVGAAVHSGRLPSVEGGYLGSTAAFAVRLCMTTEPGQILLSHVTEALLEGEVRAFELADLGSRPLVAGSRPEHVFMVVSHKEAEPGLR
jgi:class 3 adenylate cyclase